MKIFIICSKQFYNLVSPIKAQLEASGHVISLPNCFDDPETESRYRNLSPKQHAKWKSEMIKHSQQVIMANDAVLVLNFNKNGVDNYIGGATFLEMYDAFRLNKKIYLYNDIPDGILKDEICGFMPIVIKADLSKVK